MAEPLRIGVVSASVVLSQRLVATLYEAYVRIPQKSVESSDPRIEIPPDSPLFALDDRLSYIFGRPSIPASAGTPPRDRAPRAGESADVSDEPAGTETAKAPMAEEQRTRNDNVIRFKIRTAAKKPAVKPKVSMYDAVVAAISQLISRRKRDADTGHGSPADGVLVEFHCLGLGQDDDLARGELTRFLDGGDVVGVVLCHRVLAHADDPEDKLHTVSSMVEVLRRLLPDGLPERPGLRVAVVLEDALLPASFLSPATDESELEDLAKTLDPRGTDPFARQRLESPVTYVDGDDYLQHVLSRYAADPHFVTALKDLAAALRGAEGTEDLRMLHLVDVLGTDKERNEIAAICRISNSEDASPTYETIFTGVEDFWQDKLGRARRRHVADGYAHRLSTWVPYGFDKLVLALVAEHRP